MKVTYNGTNSMNLCPKRPLHVLSQNDAHVAEMTIKETLDFSARCQGVGSRYGIITKIITLITN